MWFFNQLKQKSLPIINDIMAHPFNQALHNGSLSSIKFTHYLQQDANYLHHFSQAFTIASKRFESHYILLSSFAEYIKDAELELHRNRFMRQPSQSFFSSQKTELTISKPIINDYINHLLNAAKHHSLSVVIASFTPCFWIYAELGKQMTLMDTDKNHPYFDWITSYSDPQFIHFTQELMQTGEMLHQQMTCPNHQEEVFRAFETSMRYEKLFFDESWGVDVTHQPSPVQLAQ